MTVPAIIDRVLSTVNREDTEAFLDLFSDDGEVDDWDLFTEGAQQSESGRTANSLAPELDLC